MKLQTSSKLLSTLFIASTLCACGTNFQTVGRHADDTVTTASVKYNISHANLNCGSNNISVTTKAGVVYLSGLVDNRQILKSVIHEAKRADGVKRVNTTNLFVRKATHA